MKNSIGNNVSITLFGESHGEAIGAVLDGIAPGITVDREFIAKQLNLRKPIGEISTPRKESDDFKILSGVFEGKTTGTPICIIVPNKNTISKDYSATRFLARPGHADYTAYSKYHGFEDYRGGGHFSGRVTAAIVAVGAIAISALEKKGIKIGTHISRCAGINDIEFTDLQTQIDSLNNKDFAVIDDSVKEKMIEKILAAKKDGDSVGGILETVVTGVPAGVGEPWFDTIESMLSHALFSIPAVKGVEFGDGFAIVDKRGSSANDEFFVENGVVTSNTNNNGGINGGISNGMPIIFRSAVKPTPTIHIKKSTIDFEKNENSELLSAGRHDPCIVHRARVVVDSITAIVLCDILSTRFGTDWLAN